MNKNEIHRWGEMIEAGLANEPTLKLANELRNRRPVAAKPTLSFVRGLRQSLLAATNDQQRKSLRRFVPALIIAAVGFIALFLILPSETVSAEQVLERANLHYANLAQENGILHTEFTLTATIIDHYEWDGEVWQSLANPDFRHQLIDQQGDYHYFAQRHGNLFRRSAQPVTAAPSELAYVVTEEHFYSPNDRFGAGLAPIFGDLLNWLSLESWWISQAAECENPFCLIGLETNALWTCENETCVFPLSSALGDIPAVDVEVTLIGQEQMTKNQMVEVVEIRTSLEDEPVRQLKFDSTTYELVELVAYEMDSEIARMTFQSREILDEQQELLFAKLPDQLRPIVWENDEAPAFPSLHYAHFPSPPRGSVATVWPKVVFSLPPKGSTLDEQIDLVLFVEVNGDLQEDVELIASFCRTSPQEDPKFNIADNCLGLASATASMPRKAGTARIRLQAQADETWPETVWIMLQLVYADGQSVATGNPEHFWFVER